MDARNLSDATLDRACDYDHVGRLINSQTGANARAHLGLAGGAWVGDGPYGLDTTTYDVWGNVRQRVGWGGEHLSVTAGYTNNRRDGSTYDAAGNLTSDGGQWFTYDATGQQTAASFNGLQMSYDGDRRRVRKVEDWVPTLYLRSSVLGNQVVAEIVNGVWARGYVYLGGQRLASQQSGVTWVHQDPVAKSQRLTDAAGNVTAGVELDPWGGETARSWNSAQPPRKYTTYERDLNSSDEAMHRRYNRWWARFDQPDPYDGSYDLRDPQSFNRYAYCFNDPVNFVDPDGEIPILAMAAGGAASAALGYGLAKLTGQDYSWGDAAIDFGTGAVGAGLLSKAQKLYRISQLRKTAQARGLAGPTQKGYVETWKKGIERLNIKHEAAKSSGLQPGSYQPRFDYRIAPGQYWNPFTGQVGPAGALSHVPLEPPISLGVAAGVGAVTGASGSAVRGALNDGERPDPFDERMDALMRNRGRRWSAADQAFWNLGMMSMMFDRMRNTVNMGSLGTVTVYANGTSTYRGPLLPR